MPEFIRRRHQDDHVAARYSRFPFPAREARQASMTTNAYPQGRVPRRRSRHAIPSRHQDGAEGNAADHRRPLIQYAVDEAIEAGCDTLVFVTNRYKHAVADYFDKAYELEQKLERAGKIEQLELVRDVLPDGVRAVFVTQAEALGLGHAVLCAQADHRRRTVRGAAARRPDLEPRARRAQADGRRWPRRPARA